MGGPHTHLVPGEVGEPPPPFYVHEVVLAHPSIKIDPSPFYEVVLEEVVLAPLWLVSSLTGADPQGSTVLTRLVNGGIKLFKQQLQHIQLHINLGNGVLVCNGVLVGCEHAVLLVLGCQGLALCGGDTWRR